MAATLETHIEIGGSESVFFRGSDVDLTYLEVTTVNVGPVTEATVKCSNKAEFKFPKLDGGWVYQANNIQLKVEVSITDQKGGLLPLAGNEQESTHYGRLKNLITKEVKTIFGMEPEEVADEPKHRVAPVNNLLHSLISGIDFIVGDKNLNPAENRNYNYSSFIRNNTMYNALVKGSWLETVGWAEDDYEFMDDTAGENMGFLLRHAWFFNDNGTPKLEPKTLIGKLDTCLSNCQVPIPPGVNFFIRLWLANSDFLLIQNQTDSKVYSLQFTNMELHVPIGKLNPTVHENLMRNWSPKNKIVMPYRRYIIEESAIAPKSTTHKMTFLGDNSLPSRLVICFVSEERINNKHKNPYKFERVFDGGPNGEKSYISKISVTLNSSPIDALTDEMTRNDCTAMFMRFNEVGGFLSTPFSNSINMESFAKANFFACYDLSVGRNSNYSNIFPTVRTGHLVAQITFSRPLFEEVRMFALTENPCTASIEMNGKVGLSFAS